MRLKPSIFSSLFTSPIRIGVLVAVFLVALGLSFALKQTCLHAPWGGESRLEYAYLCYNDLQPLYGVRNLHKKAFPYIVERSYEYPVVIGLEMWVASLFASDHAGFFLANVPFLAASALLALLGLTQALGPRRRLLWFAAGLPVILYSFHNWDLLAVAPLCLGIWAWASRRDFLCGFSLGVGAAAKLFPGFVLPALWIARRSSIKSLSFGAISGWSLFNLPIIAATYLYNGDITGWTGIYAFHSRRLPDFGTSWYWFADKFSSQPWIPVVGASLFAVICIGFVYRNRKKWNLETTDLVGAAAIAAVAVSCLAAIMYSGSIRHGATSQEYRWLVDRVSFWTFGLGSLGIFTYQWIRGRDAWATGGAVVGLFLLVSKVHSPQYTLWLVPFFVVTSTPAWLIASYFVVDAGLYVTGFYWFVTSHQLAENSWQIAFAVTVLMRSALLVLVIGWYCLGARDLTRNSLPDPSPTSDR